MTEALKVGLSRIISRTREALGVLILTKRSKADDQDWLDYGFNGYEPIRTLNLDALAGQGLKFNRWYAALSCAVQREEVESRKRNRA